MLQTSGSRCGWLFVRSRPLQVLASGSSRNIFMPQALTRPKAVKIFDRWVEFKLWILSTNSQHNTMLRPSLAPRIGRALFKQPSFFAYRRSIHSVPPLDQNFSKEGVPGLLSVDGFNIAWTQYQEMMVQGLNRLLVGMQILSSSSSMKTIFTNHQSAPGDASLDTKNILEKYARDPNQAPTFNYASMAHNNHFFFKTLSRDGVRREIPSQLKEKLTESFSSIDTLKREFVNTACAMFGPGFVWLVVDRPGNYSLVSTYLAGSPYPKAHFRRQNVDMNTEDKSIPEAVRNANRLQPVNGVGAHGPQSGNKLQLPPGAADITPVLCLNTWEHVYLRDYGVANKRLYVEKWWDVIDWEVVAGIAGVQNAAPRGNGKFKQ